MINPFFEQQAAKDRLMKAVERENILAMTPGQDLDEKFAINVMGRGHNKTVWGQKPFTPSRCIKSAMEALDMFPVVRIYKHSDITNGQWEVCFVPNDFELTKTVYSKSLPEAISKAALLAVME